MAQKLTKNECIDKINSHISGCKKQIEEYVKEREWNAAKDLESRVDGLELALEYVKQIK